MHHKGLKRRVKKAWQAPGTPMYTGSKKDVVSTVTAINYHEHAIHEITGKNLNDCEHVISEPGITWLHVEGLTNTPLIESIAARYQLHPLTVEDILNVEQRSKIEEFENYIFLTLKILVPSPSRKNFSIDEMSLILGKNFVITFMETHSDIFKSIREKMHANSSQPLRQHGADYLAYRLIDAVIDGFFLVLENVSDQITELEELIIDATKPINARSIYKLRRKVLTLRRVIWPMREIVSHLMQADEKMVTPFTRVYMRDIYDHAVQAIDFIDSFRDMIAGLMEMYLTNLTNRMNEIMKVLTVIATIFIPVTFIGSIYGMNFKYMPELQWHYGYPMVLSVMAGVIIFMLTFFYRKKWL